MVRKATRLCGCTWVSGRGIFAGGRWGTVARAGHQGPGDVSIYAARLRRAPSQGLRDSWT